MRFMHLHPAPNSRLADVPHAVLCCAVQGLDNVRIRIQEIIMNCDIPNRMRNGTGR